jgi:Tfp pilus assembly protein FimV
MTTPDPLSEAEIYAAYGRTAQAVALLRQALQAQPERKDIQQRLEALERQAEAERPSRHVRTLVLAALALLALIFVTFQG